MRHIKQKKEPFFVKRIRLRRSVIKTNQILQMISNDLEPNKFAKISGIFGSEELEYKNNKKLTLQYTTFKDINIYTKNTQITSTNIKNLTRMCSEKKNNEAEIEMSKVGLAVRRIVGDPAHKKLFHYSRDNVEKSRRKDRSSSFGAPSLAVRNQNTISQSEQNEQLQQSKEFYKKCSTITSPNKNRSYLYKKMANSQKTIHYEQNQIYEKRIKSYTDFLWKCLLAHNIYINLDLEMPKNIKKYKAFIGYGNNCNMIKGLIKRRFWWSLSDEQTDECLFIWTQIKVNKIFERQEAALLNKNEYKNLNGDNQSELRVASSSLDKRSKEAIILNKKLINESSNRIYSPNCKIWNAQDFNSFKIIFKKEELKMQTYRQGFKLASYKLKTEEINKKAKRVTIIEDVSNLQLQNFIEGKQSHNYYKTKPLIHNHLQNNFHLGNKKALFYNLRQYYQSTNRDVFQYVPLTFHIREGFKDPEYQKFIKYYEDRAQSIKKGRKTRNIWIVKPGQNSNQGRGITVIDEIYQLNHIIKESTQGGKINRKGQQSDNGENKTFIVQMYIDRPFLYNERKFDIRHYMLITNLYGATKAYWYEEGYIRTSAYFFNINNFEPEIHLTNDAIQKNYPQYGRYEPYNKISYSEFQNYLNSLLDRKYNFKEEILPKMKAMARDAAKSVFTKISPHNQMHNFQIFGLDFMIDRDFRPWLIEINTNPCLDCSCPLLDRIIPYMVEQGLKLSLDLVYPPPTHYPNTSKHYAPLINMETFKYQLIFDSLNEGQEVNKLYSKGGQNILNNIGCLQQDQEFKDDGKEIRLQDFT